MKNHGRNYKIYLQYGAMIFLCMLIGFYYYSKHLTDTFLYDDISLMILATNSDKLSIPDFGKFSSLNCVPGRIMFLAILQKITNISPQTLQFLPIGSLLIPITFFALGKRVLASTTIISLLAIELILDPSYTLARYSIFAYALTIPMYFVYMIIFMKYIRAQNVNYFIILMLLFLATNSIHYTVTFWMILFTLCANLYIILAKISKKKTHSHNKYKLTINLFLIFVVYFLSFNSVFYEAYLPNMEGATEDAKVMFIDKMPFEQMQTQSFFYVRPQILSTLSFIHILIIIVPLIIFGLYYIFKFGIVNNDVSIIIFSILSTGLIDIIVYTLRGDFSTKYISLLFPLVVFYLLISIVKETKLKKLITLKHLYIFIFIAILIVKVIAYSNVGYIGSPAPSYGDVDHSTKWVYSKSNDYRILTDFNIYGVYSVNGILFNKTPTFIHYTEKSYEEIIAPSEKSNLNNICDFIVIDIKSISPTESYLWFRFNPFIKYIDELESNKNINKIYAGDPMWIFQPN